MVVLARGVQRFREGGALFQRHEMGVDLDHLPSEKLRMIMGSRSHTKSVRTHQVTPAVSPTNGVSWSGEADGRGVSHRAGWFRVDSNGWRPVSC